MRRLRLYAKNFFDTHPKRQYHKQAFDLSKIGRIIQLSPDRKKSDTDELYLQRCFDEAYKIKSDADKNNCFTLFVRGTVMSENRELRESTISLFSRDRTNPPTLSPEMARSLTTGHVSLYMNEKFLSHLRKNFPDFMSSLRFDVERSIVDRHCTSLYAFQLSSAFFPGLSDRLDNKLNMLKKYHLKPSESTDNCASAISKILFPDMPVLPENINPLAAAADVVLKTLEKDDFSKDSDAIRTSLILSGCTRSLHQVAKDEFQSRQTLRDQSEAEVSNASDNDTPKPFRQ